MTTVHKDVTERLRAQNRTIFEQVREVLDKNKAERHMRGGEATKQKYILQKARLG
jgi:putative DeoR family transcriptional regulator (stage III sporulation protein D)